MGCGTVGSPTGVHGWKRWDSNTVGSLTDVQGWKGRDSCTAGSPAAVPEGRGRSVGSPIGSLGGKKREGRSSRPVLAFVHPFPVGCPKVDTPSQRRQGTA